tara:strand:+ start:561 stop:1304 length:744 start_codon:yes stop_codon:yes gene_type:complete
MNFSDTINNLKNIKNNIDKKLFKYSKKLKFIRKKSIFNILHSIEILQLFSILSISGGILLGIVLFSFEILIPSNQYNELKTIFYYFLILPIFFFIISIPNFLSFIFKNRIYNKLNLEEKKFVDYFSYINKPERFNTQNIIKYYKDNCFLKIHSNIKDIIDYIKKDNDSDTQSIFYSYIFIPLLIMYSDKDISKSELIAKTNFSLKELNIKDSDFLLIIQNGINEITIKENNFITDNILKEKDKTIVF